MFGACGSDNGGNGDGGGDSGNGDGTMSDAVGDQTTGLGDAATVFPCDGCTTFPPLGTTTCAPNVLGPSKLVYPIDGLLLPPNMNVLEVQWLPPQGGIEYEVDFENGITDVRVQTFCDAVPDVRDPNGPGKGCGLTLPQQAWTDIANANRDGDPVTVTVRATIDGSCVTTSAEQVRLSFAKDDLAGGIYYWQSATYGGIGGKTGGIYSHDFGTFDPTPTPFYTADSSGTCVGCHIVSRDGARMSLAFDDPDGDDEFSDVHTAVLDIATKTKVGIPNNANLPGFQTFTHDHSRMIATTYTTLANKAFVVYDGDGANLLATDTLPNNMVGTQPDMSKDDSTLVFVSPAAGTIPGNKVGDCHFMGGSLYTASFSLSTNALGTPNAILTATGTQNFYYPSFAPDGSFIVFNEADDASSANNDDDAFYNRKARVKILHNPPQQGDTPIDLPALNVADGLSNSWPRWSPFVGSFHGKNILWVTFSSNRDYGLHLTNKGFDNCYPPESPAYDQPQPLSKQNTTYQNCAQPQIWMAAVMVDPNRSFDNQDRSYPAFWLPFQDVNSHNHSAQWVEKVQGPPPPQNDAGGQCLPVGSTCGGDAGAEVCCQLCCNGQCAATCIN